MMMINDYDSDDDDHSDDDHHSDVDDEMMMRCHVGSQVVSRWNIGTRSFSSKSFLAKPTRGMFFNEVPKVFKREFFALESNHQNIIRIIVLYVYIWRRSRVMIIMILSNFSRTVHDIDNIDIDDIYDLSIMVLWPEIFLVEEAGEHFAPSSQVSAVVDLFSWKN